MNNKSINSIKTNNLWHRRLGLSTFVVLIFLAISGFTLNHSPGLKLNQINLSSNWLLSWYGFEVQAAEGFNVGEKWFYQDGNQALLVDGDSIAPCTAPLRDLVQTADSILALCADSVVVLTSDGQFVEQFGTVDGLPAGIQSLTVLDDRIYLATNNATLEFDVFTLGVTPSDIAIETIKDSRQMATPLPKPLQEKLKEQASGPSVSLETVILDLHSGRFFGQFGVLFIDLIGLLVCFLSITGLIAWIKRR